MSIDFHKDMDKYLISKRRKKLFSKFKSNIMNKKAIVSHKAQIKLGGLKGKLASRLSEMKKKKVEQEKEIKQHDIDRLVEEKSIEKEPSIKTEDFHGEKEEGWKEVKLTNLEAEKEKIEADVSRLQEKGKVEKDKLTKSSRENIHSREDKSKRIKLKEEIDILKEKQKIEEDRLTQLKSARRIEQMDNLRGKVMNILFKKKPKKEKDMAEEVRKEIRTGAKIDAAKKEEQPKIEEKKKEVKEVKEIKVEQAKETSKVEVKEEKIKVEKKPKKSFLSKFIQIKTSAQAAREEAEKLKQEEEKALKDQQEINRIFQQDKEAVRSNVPAQESNVNMLSTLFSGETKINSLSEQSANISTLFPGENTQQMEDKVQNSEDTIHLDDGYKIKVVRNQ